MMMMMMMMMMILLVFGSSSLKPYYSFQLSAVIGFSPIIFCASDLGTGGISHQRNGDATDTAD